MTATQSPRMYWKLTIYCAHFLWIILFLCGFSSSKVFYNVTCGSDLMQVTLNLTAHPESIVYLQNLKGYPGCEPEVYDNLFLFRINLNGSEVHCGVSKMLNKQSGHNIFYHRVVIEKPLEGRKDRELLFVQCVIPGDFNMEFVRMDWLKESIPFNFTTPTSPPFTLDVVPYVNIAIRDKGLQLDTSSIIHPGSLLDLLVYLDKEATEHYDISLRYLTLADPSRSQEEVVIMNGCSVDPFVLEVLYPPVDGVLRSQFRAFKFQSSDFVLFFATVSVCLQECVQVECLGETSGGRRKREIPKFLPHYSNEMFEVEITTFLKIESDVRGDIIREDSTNDTLDMYDADYSSDFNNELIAAGSLTSRSTTANHNIHCTMKLFCIATIILGIINLKNFLS